MKKVIIFAITAVAAVIASNFFTSCNKEKTQFPATISGTWDAGNLMPGRCQCILEITNRPINDSASQDAVMKYYSPAAWAVDRPDITVTGTFYWNSETGVGTLAQPEITGGYTVQVEAYDAAASKMDIYIANSTGIIKGQIYKVK